jgi:hypothetical protein
MMDRAVEMSVEAFCMAVGTNGSLLNQYVDEKWSVYLFAHYPEFADGVWQIHRGQLLVDGEPEHPALYTRKSLNKMFGTKNIKQFFDYYRGQWDAYRLWQDEQIEADEIEASQRESLDPVDLEDDGLTEDERAYFDSDLPYVVLEDDIIEEIKADDAQVTHSEERENDRLTRMRVTLRKQRERAGIPPTDPYYGSPDGPYNQ